MNSYEKYQVLGWTDSQRDYIRKLATDFFELGLEAFYPK